MRLRLHHDTEDRDQAPAPLPFPRHSLPGRDAGREDTGQADTLDAARMAEDALDRVQRGLDELDELVDSLPFPAVSEDDGPWAA